MNLKDYVAAYLRHVVDSDQYELIEPHLLYLDIQQSVSYLDAMKNASYAQGFHADLKNIMQDQSSNLVLGKNLTLIDLGPGYPDKTLPLMETVFKSGYKLHYIPVDISKIYLDIAARAAMPFATTITPVQALFHEAQVCASKPLIKDDRNAQRLAYLGLTFMNFVPENILPVLKNLSGKHGLAAIASELITLDNPVERILSQYNSSEVENFAFGPLRHLGLQQDECTPTLQFDARKSRIELGFRFNTRKIAGRRINHITTAVSYRYSEDQLNAMANQHFSSYVTYKSPNNRTAMTIGRY